MNTAMKLVALVAVGTLTSCVSIRPTHVDDAPPIESSTDIRPDRAYFYGSFTFGNSPRNTHVTRFREIEERDSINIPVGEFDGPILIEVPPGTYRSTFNIYSWDVLWWGLRGSYQRPKQLLGERFAVEAGSIYYVGTFGSEFTIDFGEARATFHETFGNQPDMEFRMAYGDAGRQFEQ